MRKIAIFSGRFSPFHINHFYVYSHLVNKFGQDNVWIATSDKVEQGKSPFTFKEKKAVITKLYDIPKSKIVQVRNPYQPREILSKLPTNTSYISAVGDDAKVDKLCGRYFKSFKFGVRTGSYLNQGYVYRVPNILYKVKNQRVSGTMIRKKLLSKDANAFFKSVYPKYNKDVYKMMVRKVKKFK